MSMIGWLRLITPEQLEDFHRNPKSVRKFLKGKVQADASTMRAALERVQQIGLQAHASGAAADPVEREKIRLHIVRDLQSTWVNLMDNPSAEGLRREKSWHSLHYLLTGEVEAAAPPLGNTILGGKEIGEDVGYGPARFLTPQQVKEVALALAAVTPEDLAGRFDLDAMQAHNICACVDNEELEMAQHFLQLLSSYYADAASQGNAMLLWIE